MNIDSIDFAHKPETETGLIDSRMIKTAMTILRAYFVKTANMSTLQDKRLVTDYHNLAISLETLLYETDYEGWQASS